MGTAQIYERVLVARSEKFPELVGKHGWVLGISEEDGVVYGYGVHFDDLPTGYYFYAGDVEPTGEIANRSRFYDEDAPTIRVRVEGNHGYLAED